MAKTIGFQQVQRQDRPSLTVAERVQHFHEFVLPLSEQEMSGQGARCLTCGVPFCHEGCPIHNLIPDFNSMVYQKRWEEALELLHSANNFPEFTGRVCPSPCEPACTLNINNNPVTIKSIECAIVDKGWEEGWIVPLVPTRRTGKRVAVVGSGPAGLACAQQLARAGHLVTVFEKADRVGGLLRYGIPDFKMDKPLIDRRVAQMEAEGVTFRTGCHVGVDLPASRLVEEYHAVVLAGGAEQPRDLPVPGRGLAGVHFAMDYLTQQNRRVAGETVPEEVSILATGKHVVVIGGGDTGSDCIGTANRQSARSVTQLEILPRPPEKEDKAKTWPNWPVKLRTSSSHEEGCERLWSVATKWLAADAHGQVRALHGVRVTWRPGPGGRDVAVEVPDSAFELPADLVLLAMGFTNPVHDGLLAELGVALDARGHVAADTESYRTSLDKVFTAGDMRRGQSLVVWAIQEGRRCARSVDEFLMGRSELPT